MLLTSIFLLMAAFLGRNDEIKNATIYFYSETAPTEPGNYWRYVDGVPTPWEWDE